MNKTTGVFAAILILLALSGPGTAPAAAQAGAQDGEASTLRVTAMGGLSVREAVTGLRFGEDVLTGSVRITYLRSQLRPWVQVERFTRPELACQPPLICSDEGWTALVGVTSSSGARDSRPGVHVHLLTGIGWAFAEESRFAYMLGVGAAYPITRWLAPTLEFRWEDLPGIRNVFMINAGVRLDLF